MMLMAEEAGPAEIHLVYRCGCVENWTVSRLIPGQEVEMPCKYNCSESRCWDRAAHDEGRCQPIDIPFAKLIQ